MKKTFSIIALFMVCFLIIPSVPCYASDSIFQLKTSLSVDGFYNDQNIDTYSSNFINYNGDYVSNYYDALNSLNVDSSLTPFLVARFFRSGSNITSYRLYVFCYNNNYEINDINIVSTGGLDSLGAVGTCYMFVDFNNSLVDSSDWLIKGYECVFQSDGSFSWNNVANILQVNYMSGNKIKYTFNSSFTSFIDCDYSCFANNEIISSGVGNVTSSISAGDYFNYDRSLLHDLLSSDMPYVDSTGNTIIPAPDFQIESNENHMYLKSCDVGFCKPYSVSDLSSAGGGYLYVNYTYDNWINSHSSDYWVNIRTVVNVDGTQYSGINTRALDLNGVNVLTFSESTVPNNWTNEGLLFVEFPNTVISTYKAGYVYSIPYPTFANTDSNGVSNRSRFLGNGRNRLFLTPSGGRGYDITNQPLGDALRELFNVVVHQKFTITVTVWLQDTNNNRSGEFTKSFNLITGVGTTTDTGITDNDNPFEPDPMLPDVPDGSGNDSNSLAPVVNNFLINANGKIGYDPGYRDLKNDLDADPDDNFTQYLAPFKNNEIGGFVGDFLDDMPTALKSIFIGGFGVLTLLGIYRFIRRG